MNLLVIRSVISKILKFLHYNVLDENNPVINMIFFYFKLYDCRIELSQFQFDGIVNLKMPLGLLKYLKEEKRGGQR